MANNQNNQNISDKIIEKNNRNARLILLIGETLLFCLVLFLFLYYQVTSFIYYDIQLYSLFPICIKTLIFFCIIFISSRVYSRVILKIKLEARELFSGFFYMFKIIIFIFLPVIGFFIIINFLALWHWKDVFQYTDIVSYISENFLYLNHYDKVELKWHFQNLFIFYIPLCIAWFSTLLVMGFGPVTKGVIYKDIIKKIRESEKKKKFKNIYLLNFLKAIFIKYQFPFVFGMVMHFLLFSFPIINLLFQKIFFERFQSFSSSIAYPSFLFSTIAFFLAPVVYSYFNLDDTYEFYTAYYAKNKILNKFKDHYLILGYGNLGKRIVNHVIVDYFLEENKGTIQLKKDLAKNLEVIIDNNMELKVVASDFAVINKNEYEFFQIISDKSGFKYGFVKTGRDENLLLLGVVGDASNPSELEILNYGKAKVIINATSDVQLPFKIFGFIENKESILSVPNTTSFFALYRHCFSKEIFLVLPIVTGSISVSNLLLLFLEKIRVKKELNKFADFLTKEGIKVLNKNKILIIGRGRGLFYILEQFKCILSHDIPEAAKRKKLLENSIIILNDDEIVRTQSELLEEKSNKGFWGVSLDRYGEKINDKYKIPVYFSNPTDYSSIADILENPSFNNEEANISLIAIFSEERFESLRILTFTQNILRAKTGSHKKESEELPLILISTPSIEKELVKDKLKFFDYIYKREDNLFPTQRNLQLVHDYSVGDEVASILRSYMQMFEKSETKTIISRLVSYIKIKIMKTTKKTEDKNVSSPFLLSLCIYDRPKALMTCLLYLAGFKIYEDNSTPEKIPSFHATNTLIDRKNADAYIIEGLASMEKFEDLEKFLRGIFIQSKDTNLKRINDCIQNALLDPLEYKKFLSDDDKIEDAKELDKFDCIKCCSICPISIVANKHDFDHLSKNDGNDETKRLYLFKDKNANKILKNNTKKRAYAKIWIYGVNANIPGALSVGLKDLLFLKWKDIETARNETKSEIPKDGKNTQNKTPKKDFINIKYLSNLECPGNAEYTVRQLYGVIESINSDKRKAQIKELKKGTIEAVCIKSAAHETWNPYAEDLVSFLNEEYRSKKYFLDRKLRRNYPYCNLILKRNQNLKFRRRILRKIEVFFSKEEREEHLKKYKDCIKESGD